MKIFEQLRCALEAWGEKFSDLMLSFYAAIVDRGHGEHRGYDTAVLTEAHNTPRHLLKAKATEQDVYHKQGAHHWGDWYDEPTGAWQVVW